MARICGADIKVFDIGGENLLADLVSAEFQTRVHSADATPVALSGKVRVPVKQSCAVKGILTSRKSSNVAVTHIDVSGLELDGLDYKSFVERGVFEGRIDQEESSGVGDEWEFPVAVKKDYRARLELYVESDAPTGALIKGFSDLSGKQCLLDIVINGVNVAVPMTLQSFKHIVKAGKVQRWIIELEGSAVIGSVYPFAPTGADNMLAFCFNTPQQALELVMKASDTFPQMEGQFLVERFGFVFSKNALVESHYEFLSRGVVLLT